MADFTAVRIFFEVAATINCHRDYRETSVTLLDLLAIIDADRHDTDLASAIRVFVLGFYRDQIATLKSQPPIGVPTAPTAH